MVLNTTLIGEQIYTAFALGLFGNEIFLGLTILIVALIMMMFLRVGVEGVLAILIGFTFVLTPNGIISDAISTIMVILAGYLLGSGLWRAMRRD